MSSLKIRKMGHPKQFKYEFERRREKWKLINEPLEKLLMIPPEEREDVVRGLVSETCYTDLAEMLGLPCKSKSAEADGSAETLLPFISPDDASLITLPRISNIRSSKVASEETVSESITSSQYDVGSFSLPSRKPPMSESTIEEILTKTDYEEYELHSIFVEVEKKIAHDQEQMLKHKAILRFLDLSEAEAASWRVKETKDVNDLSEMTLEEQGDFLINKIAEDFCSWLRELGGDEQSFISEDILKELFQVGMDNPASRAISIQMIERRVLFQKLAMFLHVPQKSFHSVLSEHLNWDVKVEKKAPKLIAFDKALPNDQKFKTPKNMTAETWLEWNKMDPAQLNFADVYEPIKELRSTKEYCKWLAVHPEHDKPQYLVDQGMFRRSSGTTKENQEIKSTQNSFQTHLRRKSTKSS